MTRTVTAPDLRPLPRFTFAGRGCRDPRREPRRLAQALRIQPSAPSTATTSPVTTALSEADRPSARRSSTAGPAAGDDRPPLAPCDTVPGRGGHR
jgi:hypothetical protein